MNTPNDFQQLRKRAIVCAAFAAAFSAISASMVTSGHQLAGLIIIAVQFLLVVLTVVCLFKLKGAGKASEATGS
jgi:hypothetical protein